MTAAVTTPVTVTIPTATGLPDYTMRVRLDGKDYNFRFIWNERVERWSMSIYSDDNEPLVLGIFVTTNYPMLRYYHYNPDVPPGELIAIDLTGDGSSPGLYDMAEDKRVQLTYYPTTDR